MKLSRMSIAVLLLVSLPAVAEHSAPSKPAHKMISPAEITWVDAPPVLPKGALVTVLSGDPSKPGLFVLRLKLPAGYKVAPHWHPVDEHLTVVSGTVSFGMGDKFDKSALHTLSPGGYGYMPTGMTHYLWSENGGELQVMGTGPFAMNYVNPADDPSKAAAAGAAK